MAFPIPLFENPKVLSFVVVLLFMFLYYQTRVLHVETSSLRKCIGTVARGVSDVAQKVATRVEPEPQQQQRHRRAEDDDENELPFPYNQDENAPYNHYEDNVMPQSQRQIERTVRDERKVASEKPPPQQPQRRAGEETGRQGTNADPIHNQPEVIRKPAAAQQQRKSAQVCDDLDDCMNADFGDGIAKRYK